MKCTSRFRRRARCLSCSCVRLESKPAERKPGRFVALLDIVTKALIPILLVWSLLFIGLNMKSRTLVEPVSVPTALSGTGVTDLALQQALITRLDQLISDAKQTMPGDIKDEFQADVPLPVVDMPGTGISLQSFVQYTKQLLGIDDVVIRSVLISDTKGYTVHVYVTGPSLALDQETSPPEKTPMEALSGAARLVMQNYDKFAYASALATNDRTACYEHGNCDYTESIKALHEVLKDDTYVRYHKWTWLALSKVDEDRHDFAGEVTKALLAIRQDRTLFWAYYNWGIGLSEQGCDSQALAAFNAALRYRPTSDFVNNAAGRQALILAVENDGVDPKLQRNYLNFASSYLTTATYINPAYAEAYVNLAKVLLTLGDKQEATDAFDAVLLADSPQVRRADYFEKRANLKISSGLQITGRQLQSVIATLEDAHEADSLCGNSKLAGTILETKGCLSAEELTIEQKAGNQLKNIRRPPEKSRTGALNCDRQSVEKNVGEPRPELLAPVY
ncbi:tetratricopeptide repeat protein [Paraburkholderia sp. UCT31]|uniref:tetratricopeptide repeat protein n=1 Tax=Paraburkholderia sp. UCT31 TaxID=2615209 RepID=UPI0016552BE3|nr:tetratricopeptide repeat protein [Paraburkholderia sp. UCT31]MBC8742723.1 tetratricopeptide repeat protein [Paraburkholderia sp. UCT31]